MEFMYVTCFFLFFFCFFVFLFLYSFVCRAILVKAKTDYLSAASHCTNVNFLFFFIIYLFLLFYCHLFLHFIIIFILFLILLLLSLLLKYLSGLYSKPRFCFFPERESIPPRLTQSIGAIRLCWESPDGNIAFYHPYNRASTGFSAEGNIRQK